MHMSYYFGSLHELVVFPFWKPDNTAQTILTCFVAIILVILLQTIKIYRQKCLRLPDFDLSQTDASVSAILFDKNHLLSSFLLFLQHFLSYTLMLAAMLYNLWLILSICFGFMLSYWVSPFIFRTRSQLTDERLLVDEEENMIQENLEELDENCC